MRPSASIESLPQRFRGHHLERQARFRLTVGRTTRDVIVGPQGCEVLKASTERTEAHIFTDPATWQAIYDGCLSGIEAFAQHRLTMRGSIERALWFEPLFERPAAGGLSYEVQTVRACGLDHSVLVAGDESRPPLMLLHGMGASKASWLTVLPDLARRFRVLAVDLPGYGSSSKPLGRYDAPWFAARAFGLLDALGYDRAYLAGNSLGGRVALEMALAHPERVDRIVCLCPASAFGERPLLALVRLARPELGIALPVLPRAQVRAVLRMLFAEPERIAEVWYDAAIDDFLRTWRDPRFRIAFFATARRVYLDEPEGEHGFWRRIEGLAVPSLFIYGRHDPLITPRFGAKIRRLVPEAEVEVWEDCGHAPQVELPGRTSGRILGFLERGHAVA